MFFKLYVLLTFFSFAGLMMWYRWRQLKTNRKAKKFENTLERYGKGRRERKRPGER